ncbi:hypothetical protein QVD17_25619 [Tagetes erecta]|uniref:F-box domain-containing protein n=1 Tax=Tagetes erecta TaxID=13708 RepID=A0AAD8NVH7_TARER|nr:hypothetical protein QVD17_25619 [Tagetes erecta]
MRRKAGKILGKQTWVLDPLDSISRMPETVLQHIVSLLPTSDINRIRFLSRKWRRLGAQVETELCLIGHELNEVEFSKILNDEFHFVEDLFLTECLGMRNLILVKKYLHDLLWKLEECVPQHPNSSNLIFSRTACQTMHI